MILVLVSFALWPSLPHCPVCSHFLMLLSSLTSFSPSLSPGAITPQQHSWLPFPVSLSSLSIIHSSVHTAALPPFVTHLLSLCRRDSSHFRPLSLLFLAAVPVFEEVVTMTAAQAKFSTTCPLGIKSYSNGKERHRSKGL